MQLGASTLPFRDDRLDRDVVVKMKDTGVEAVEISDYHAGFDYEGSDSFSRLSQVLVDFGLQVNSLHAHLKDHDPDCDLTSTDPDQRSHVRDAYRRAIHVLQAIGGDILLTHDIAIPEANDPLQAEKRVALLMNLKDIAVYAEHRNIRIAVENLGYGYHRVPTRLVALVEELGQENIGLCIDTGHRNLSGNPAEAILTAGQHLFTTHIHDNYGKQDEHLLPRRGNIDWSGVMQALQAINYPGVFVYELTHPKDLQEIEKNFQALKRWGL
jgi:sugar phosphate isomerase/epimerase